MERGGLLETGLGYVVIVNLFYAEVKLFLPMCQASERAYSGLLLNSPGNIILSCRMSLPQT
jgi:hypothetical protein